MVPFIIRKRRNKKALKNLWQARQDGEVSAPEMEEHFMNILKCDASGQGYSHVTFGQRAVAS